MKQLDLAAIQHPIPPAGKNPFPLINPGNAEERHTLTPIQKQEEFMMNAVRAVCCVSACTSLGASPRASGGVTRGTGSHSCQTFALIVFFAPRSRC